MRVSLVIPGRDVARTVAACLDAVVPLLGEHGLGEIIFVDDGSTDQTAEVVRRYPVRCLRGPGRGPGQARNLGWRAARGEWIWLIDGDCVAEPDALPILLEHTSDPTVVAVGGSYGNALPHSLLACLIHEEIVERHLAMPARVDFLGSFNLLYRRATLERLGGFDQGMGVPAAEDAELAYRAHRLGGALAFDSRSRVRHYHPTRLWPYLRTQTRHAYFRTRVYARHPARLAGDSYTGLLDHLQAPLALLLLAGLPLSWAPPCCLVTSSCAGLLLLAQLPMTVRLMRRCGARFALFAALGFVRAFARGLGMARGLLSLFASPGSLLPVGDDLGGMIDSAGSTPRQVARREEA